MRTWGVVLAGLLAAGCSRTAVSAVEETKQAAASAAEASKKAAASAAEEEKKAAASVAEEMRKAACAGDAAAFFAHVDEAAFMELFAKKLAAEAPQEPPGPKADVLRALQEVVATNRWTRTKQELTEDLIKGREGRLCGMTVVEVEKAPGEAVQPVHMRTASNNYRIWGFKRFDSTWRFVSFDSLPEEPAVKPGENKGMSDSPL